MNLEPLLSLQSFARVQEVFGAPIGGAPAVPTDLERLVLQVSTWDADTRRTWMDYNRHIDEWLSTAPAGPGRVTSGLKMPDEGILEWRFTIPLVWDI